MVKQQCILRISSVQIPCRMGEVLCWKHRYLDTVYMGLHRIYCRHNFLMGYMSYFTLYESFTLIRVTNIASVKLKVTFLCIVYISRMKFGLYMYATSGNYICAIRNCH